MSDQLSVFCAVIAAYSAFQVRYAHPLGTARTAYEVADRPSWIVVWRLAPIRLRRMEALVHRVILQSRRLCRALATVPVQHRFEPSRRLGSEIDIIRAPKAVEPIRQPSDVDVGVPSASCVRVGRGRLS